MALNQTERPSFFEGEYLDAEDLTAVVDYARTQQARFALGAHTWGIAAGLQLKETPLPGGAVSVYVLPGYAWDGYGRPIVALSPYRIPEERFAHITDEGLIPIWLRYEEREAAYSTSGSAFCDVYNRGTRIQETFAIEIGLKNEYELTSGVNLAGRVLTNPQAFLSEFDSASSLVYDASIPHQNFSELSSNARWLIPIGFVRWQPVQNQLGHFAARSDADSEQSRRARRYIGVVAGDILAADDSIRLRSRSAFGPNSLKSATQGQTQNDLVSVQGSMRVEGDNRILGGSVDFRDSAGQNFGVPMRMFRTDVAENDRAIRVLIGPTAQPNNRFAITVEEGDSIEDRFVVLSGGNVGIGTTNPTDHLQVEGDLRISGFARKPDGGGWTFASDVRLKQNVEDASDALDLLMQLRGVRFEWKEPERRGNRTGSQFGLVAQEVEKVFPDWVTTDKEGYRELTMRGFEALVIEALRQLKSEIEDLKANRSSSKPSAPKPRRQPKKAKE
jgi:hypothetical protein